MACGAAGKSSIRRGVRFAPSAGPLPSLWPLDWVDWFNHRRLLEPIGNIPPAEAEASYYDQVRDMPLAA